MKHKTDYRRTPSADEGGGGAAIREPIDGVFQFSKVTGSSISTSPTQALQYDIAGIAGMELDILDNAQGATTTINFEDDKGEGIEGSDVYGALGLIGRPLPPDKRGGRDEHMEVICIREQDGLVPIAARDLRLKMAGGVAPGEGVLALVGYGGGFHSLTPVEGDSTPDGGGTIHVLYCPYDFDDDGVAQKAHSIILDPTPGNESIIIAHADGMAITMSSQDKKAILMKNASGDATFRLDDDGITMTAANIQISGTITMDPGLAGNVVIGDPFTASPLLPGVASQGSSKLFVSL